MGIVDEIMAGTATWEDVFSHNVKVSRMMVERERNNKHPADGCKRKYCKHGNKWAIHRMERHVEKLERELQLIRSGVLLPTDVMGVR